MKKIILMDMDGTLTESRKPILPKMQNQLNEIFDADIHVGILSGSPLFYIEQQMGDWLNQFRNFNKLHVFPCNGTQYVYQGNEVYSLDIKEKLPNESYMQIVSILYEALSNLHYAYVPLGLPVTGTFIQFRKSMINVCPIGRDAAQEERENFIALDKEFSIREILIRKLKAFPIFSNMTIKLGGDTSLDIYPEGWDKSYAFENFADFERIYFIGDRCDPMGNDHEAYIKAGAYGYVTTGPVCTRKIITEILSGRSS